MPPPTKRQKQAKQQYASSSRCFDNGLIEDVFEVFLDPDYVPASDAESEADSESDFNGALSFSLIDGNIGEVSDNESESDDEAAMEIVVEAEETVDYAEGCARRAAVSAQKFWANIMSSDVFSGDTKPVKGLNARQAEFAVKKYKSHRRCGPTLMMNLGVLVD
ncbi:hypothetical protein BDR03DRAFT_1094091 [Suillus americanus]|nr:hypothetical protein BDR03DRAFT_1094091 [Suillus americanus]